MNDKPTAPLSQLLANLPDQAKDNFLANLLAFGFYEQDGSFNRDKEIPGADFVEVFCDHAEILFEESRRVAEAADALTQSINPEERQNLLDGIVYEVTEQMASSINNLGPDGQCLFLAKNGLRTQHI